PSESVNRDLRKAFAAISKTAVRTKPPVRFYCEAWSNPRISSPPWVAELVRVAGGEMIVPAGESVHEEQIAAADPELIVLAWAATGDKAKAESAYSVSAWKDVSAIRNRCVCVVRDEILNTPGPPLVQGVRELARLISCTRHSA